MATFSKHTLTAWGKQLLAATQQGGGIKFTSVRYGDGYHTDLSDVTELANERVKFDIGNNYTHNAEQGQGLFAAWGFLNGAQLNDELYLREAGLWTADPADPDNRDADKLYSIVTVYTDDDRDFILRVAPTGSDALIDVRVVVWTVISANVEVTIDQWLTFEGVRSVNNVQPDEVGNVQLTHQNVGAAPAVHSHPQYAVAANLHRVATSGAFSDLAGTPNFALQSGLNTTNTNVTNLTNRVTATEGVANSATTAAAAARAAADNHAALRNNPHVVRSDQVAMTATNNTTVWTFLGGALTTLTTATRTSIIAAINWLHTQLNTTNTLLSTHIVACNNPHAVTAAQAGAAPASHNHAASNITSGTLPVVRGGTGRTSLPARAILTTDSGGGITGGGLGWQQDTIDFPAQNEIPRAFDLSRQGTGGNETRRSLLVPAISGTIRDGVNRMLHLSGGTTGTIGGVSGTAWLALTSDVTSALVRSLTIHDRVYTQASNLLRVTTSGTIGRSTSAKRYKRDIRDMEFDPSFALKLQPRSWIDVGMYERTKKALESDEINSDYGISDKEYYEKKGWSLDTLPRVVGFVAEEVEALPNGDCFVEYDEDGKVSGLAYDRMFATAIYTMRDQQSRIEQLEKRLAAVEKGAK